MRSCLHNDANVPLYRAQVSCDVVRFRTVPHTPYKSEVNTSACMHAGQSGVLFSMHTHTCIVRSYVSGILRQTGTQSSPA